MENDKKVSTKELPMVKSLFMGFSSGNVEKDYDLVEVIDSNSSNKITKVINKKSGKAAVLKTIKKGRELDPSTIYLQVEILRRLSHPSIVQIYEYYEDMKYFKLIFEHCEGSELFDQIVNKGSLNEDEAALIMRQILSAVSYIHSNMVCHRDIKPENILFNSTSNTLKIIDWGTARFFHKRKKMTKYSGTPYYVAPEVLYEKYDEKCDVWSCGVILYIMLCGYPPFNGENDSDILSKIRTGKFTFPEDDWSHVSDSAKELISKMLTYNPAIRPSASTCLDNGWLKENLKRQINPLVNKKCLNNMKKFHAELKLQQAALQYIVSFLMSKEEKNEMLELFQSLDANGDGVLSREEIFEGYKLMLGETEAQKEVDRIFNEVDIDHSGSIDYNEFLIAAANRQSILNKEKLEATFKAFDKDGSGTISAEEIKSVLLANVDKKLIESTIKEVDLNGDGEISLSEFKEMMKKLFG